MDKSTILAQIEQLRQTFDQHQTPLINQNDQFLTLANIVHRIAKRLPDDLPDDTTVKMQPLELKDGRLFCPVCGKRECNLNDPPDVGVDEWECPYCACQFIVQAGTVAKRCEFGCVYSRAMGQPHPRRCVKCGQVEEDRRPAPHPDEGVRL